MTTPVMPKRKRWLTAMGLFVIAFLFAFLSGWHVAMAKGTGGNENGGTGGNNPCSGSHPPSYCHSSNWQCTGTDVGDCENGRQEVSYPAGCSPSTKYFSCGGAACQGSSIGLGCYGCHTGLFEPINSCTGGRNGANYVGPAEGCTAGCPTTTTTSSPTTGSSSPSSGTSSNTPSCTPPGSSSSSSPAGSSFDPTGCAGSCTTSGCTGTGTESGIETSSTRHCTTSYSCPGPTAHTSCSTSSSSVATTQSSATQCQQKEVLLDQCMPEEPGNREAEYCLTFNGGTTNCSAPFGVYDPTNCPIPVGIGSGS